jgi:hypothetical protein
MCLQEENRGRVRAVVGKGGDASWSTVNPIECSSSLTPSRYTTGVRPTNVPRIRRERRRIGFEVTIGNDGKSRIGDTWMRGRQRGTNDSKGYGERDGFRRISQPHVNFSRSRKYHILLESRPHTRSNCSPKVSFSSSKWSFQVVIRAASRRQSILWNDFLSPGLDNRCRILYGRSAAVGVQPLHGSSG